MEFSFCQIFTRLSNDASGVIESVKVASDLYAPCNGKVITINNNLEDKPQLINEDAFGEGWIIEIDIRDKSELDDLLDETEYKETI